MGTSTGAPALVSMGRTHDIATLEDLLGHRAWSTALARHMMAEAEVDDVAQQTWLGRAS